MIITKVHQGSFALLSCVFLFFFLFSGCSEETPKQKETPQPSPPPIETPLPSPTPTPIEKNLLVVTGYQEKDSQFPENLKEGVAEVEAEEISISGKAFPNADIYLNFGNEKISTANNNGVFFLSSIPVKHGENIFQISSRVDDKDEGKASFKIIRITVKNTPELSDVPSCEIINKERCYKKIKSNFKIDSLSEANKFCSSDGLKLLDISTFLEDRNDIANYVDENTLGVRGRLLFSDIKKGKNIQNGWVDQTFIKNKIQNPKLSNSDLNKDYIGTSVGVGPELEEFYDELIWKSYESMEEQKQYYDRLYSGFDIFCYRDLSKVEKLALKKK